MKHFLRLFLIGLLITSCSISAASSAEQLPSAQMKQWLQAALNYGFASDTVDYTKYMSTDYIEHIDGKTFNFQQWLHHMNGLKALMKSYRLSFNEIVVEGDQIAASYDVHATKKNGEQLVIRVIAIFKVKNGKMIYCDELTHLLSGPQADKNLSAQD